MADDKTTLDLAVLLVETVRHRPHLPADLAAVAVLVALHQHDAWFCRLADDWNDITITAPYEQLALFDVEVEYKRRQRRQYRGK